MKIFKFLAITLAVVLGFSSCNPKEKHDHSSDLAGTWTCLTADFAEAMVINEDGSVVSTILIDGNYLENMKGNIVVENDIVTLSFEDGTKVEGHFDIIPGMAFSIYNEDGGRMTFNYCEEDLSDEILGMWVCHEGLPGVENDMLIMTFSENGKMTMTTSKSAFISFDYVNEEVDYVIVGDLLFKNFYGENPAEGYIRCQSSRLTYSPNATTLGDILIENIHAPYQNNTVELNVSFLRVKQNLELPGMKYDYMKTFISNVNGKDMDVPFFNTTINFANFDSSIFDMFLKSTLFSVQFPNANTIEYSFLLGEQITTMQAPIMVEGNKMTIKMSELNSVYRDVEVYTFQDQDNTQMHMYMHTSTFVDFFGNMQVNLMAAQGQLDMNDAAAVNAVYDSIDEAIESINFSLVMTKAN